MTEHRSYYAIIPANVRYDKRLKPNTKLLYGEITALCNERGFCWAGNEYFADLYGVNKETISRWVSDLIKFGYLNREIIYKEGTNQIINRYLRRRLSLFLEVVPNRWLPRYRIFHCLMNGNFHKV